MNVRRRSQSHSVHPSQSQLFRSRRKRRLSLILVAVLLGLVSWAYLISRLSYIPILAIDDVRVYGARPDLVPKLRAAAFQALQGNRLGILSRSNILIYPRREISARVASSSERLATVYVERDGLHAVRISVTEKGPAAIVCDDLPNFNSEGEVALGDRCYFADDKGIIFDKAATSTVEGVIRYYIPETLSDPLGKPATSTAEFSALQSFVRATEVMGMSPKAVLMKDAREYELYIENPADPSELTVIYFNTGAALGREVSNLAAFWNSMITSPKTKGPKPSFEYIDVRYGSNVFYRTVGQTL